MTQNTIKTYEVTVNFSILAENEVDAKSIALHQSSEKYVGAPDQLSVYSRKIDRVTKLAENPIIRGEDINRRHWTCPVPAILYKERREKDSPRKVVERYGREQEETVYSRVQSEGRLGEPATRHDH